ncbi:MAG: signal recognition particle-docking protein FtsY [Pseudomonadales bacterium]|nr:signal recognition particle-docking protein FtsY [Pseudomonadales bacterium]
MFGFRKTKKSPGSKETAHEANNAAEVSPEPEAEVQTPVEEVPPAAAQQSEPELALSDAAIPEEEAKTGFFSRIKKGLGKTRSGFASGLGNLLLGEKEIDDDIMDEIEVLLVTADVGVDATRDIIDTLSQKVGRRELTSSRALYKALQEELCQLLVPVEAPLKIDSSKSPYVLLMVGVNGVGKTTTIGKIAKRFKSEGKSVMLAAGDTFRAAAVEQLQVWGERNDVPVIAQTTGSDSASVIFDALQAAKARGVDVLIADTAGRLHTKTNLMEELSKVKRVLAKLDAEAPHEVMLVIDAGTGQNALNQVKSFKEAVGVTGITLSKLDGTAKGGIIFALANQFQIPVRFIGVGEQAEDLRPFEAQTFVDALFSEAD